MSPKGSENNETKISELYQKNISHIVLCPMR